MSAQTVEAIWLWDFNSSAYRATYGRISGDTKYTKDFLQVGGECGRLLTRTFGVTETSGSSKIQFVWPGGNSSGFVSYSSDRPHLAWATNSAPQPWKLLPGAGPGTVETIPGNPGLSSFDDAEAEYKRIKAQALNPCLMAVKLYGEPDKLHIRAYLGAPPDGYEEASVDALPEAVAHAVRSILGTRTGCTSLSSAGGVTAEPEVVELIERLEDNPNQLLIGPPGTGKTVILEKLTRFVEHNTSGGFTFDPSRNHDALTERKDGFSGKARVVVMHPAYSYDNLVVGLLPIPADSGVAVKAVPGPLVNLAQFASADGNKALLVLDEFNRGNAAAVLGDVLALLDKDKRGKAFVNLPYSDLGIEVDDEFAGDGEKRVPEKFTLPPDLWIVAAMNSSDRSVAPVDAALRRRFSIREMPPDYQLLAQHLAAEESPDFSLPISSWDTAHVGSLAVKLLRAINTRIDAVLGPDFRLGHSNFWHVARPTGEESVEALIEAFDTRIVATLRMSMQDDDGALAAVLRAGTPQAPAGAPNGAAFWVDADPDLGSYASPRLHTRELSSVSHDAAIEELKRQAGV